MRLFLAVILCKLLRFIGGLIGKGSSMPGKFLLRSLGGMVWSWAP